MGLQPKIEQHNSAAKICPKCGKLQLLTNFLPSHSLLDIDGRSTLCGDCIEEIAASYNYSWEILDRLCSSLDLPWVPAYFEERHNLDKPFYAYTQTFTEVEYERLNWKEYFDAFCELKEQQLIEDELPELRDRRIAELQMRWGANYSEEQLAYLESLYQGVLSSQNVNGTLQDDQAQKLCKTSLEIDERIRAGADYDKLLSSYERLVKIADFTPKNTKNAADFDSIAEFFKWLEKRGWKNSFYDDVSRDIVDETIKNIENFNQKLYINESGIGDEITRRIEALKTAVEVENYYDTKTSYDLDAFDNEGFEGLYSADEEFEVSLNE